MTVRVLCDAIHADLWESLRLLLEVRFGWELYRPIGMEWYEQGIWNFERDRLGDQVARQFLQVWIGKDEPTIYGYSVRPDDTHPDYLIKLVTMEQAADLKPDLVIATLAENEHGLWQWAKAHGAHYGIQVGNQGAPNLWPIAEFGLLSVTTPGFTPWKPYVTYHQEFDIERAFAADGGVFGMSSNEVQTRVQCAAGAEGYGLFRAAAAEVPEAKFRWYGHCGDPDEFCGGNAMTTDQVATGMRGARIAWHWKRWSDGYGHVIHNWAAIGRPMLVTQDYYRDKLAAPLFTPETSFNLERMTVSEIAENVRRLLQDDDLYTRMCLSAATRFREVVNFEAEAEQIRTMLEGIL